MPVALRWMSPLTVSACLMLMGLQAVGQSSPEGEWLRMKPITPRGYVCNPIQAPIQIDGKLDAAEWSHASWTDDFIDIQGPSLPAPKHRTRAKLLWDQSTLYIAAELSEPHLQGTLRDHDSVIFQDNDLEVFIDPDGDNHRYVELELNTLNTTWDLFLDRPYKDGGNADNGFEIAGLRTAVQMQGTLNDPSDVDQGWTIEIAIPFENLRTITRTDCPPKPLDRWRLGFSRVEWQFDVVNGKYQKKPGLPEDNWVWSPQGIIDMHRPERWGFIEFQSTTTDRSFEHNAALSLRDQLMETYHRQREVFRERKDYAESWESLGWTPNSNAAGNGKASGLFPLRKIKDGFRASLGSVRSDGGLDVGTVSQDSRLTVRHWKPEILSALDRAGSNRLQLEQLLCDVSDAHWESAEFLVANMPDSDLTTLRADFLLNDIALANEAWETAPWGKQIPKEIFLNNVLPYANINERRDAWRKDFRERFAPLIAEAKTPSQAAALLNQRLFPLVQVKYSTKRAKADQSPYESMNSGLASCTGLSVLLIDACRACGIPARFVGTPLWSDNSGNHSWIEVWDDGWHFTGAAEPSGDQLDQAWFIGRAATAQRDDPRHAIYAVSFQKTPIHFPLVWDRSIRSISAVNVTDRYTGFGVKPEPGTQMISFRAVDPSSRSRVAAQVRVIDADGALVLEGSTKDERFDANDHLNRYLKEGLDYSVEFQLGEVRWRDRFKVDAKPKLISWDLTAVPSAASNAPTATPEDMPADTPSTTTEDPLEALATYLKQPPEQRAPIVDQPFANSPLSREQALVAERRIVADYQDSQRAVRKAELESGVIQIGDLKMPFSYKIFGDKPATGRSLYISMHGGGGAPKRVNDGQWENQKKLYQLDEGVYVAPRAPTDTWDLWHQSHIDPMFDRLIENMILCEDVNPDRVYLMGYSAGGDGVYQVAPRMADRFAAASMMAGHPNETSALGLRNLPFAIHMGANDSAYNRNQTATQWQQKLAELRQSDPEGYMHVVKLHEGKGHWMDRQDAEALPWMHQFTRNRFPKSIVWKQDDVVEERFYWLAVDKKDLPDRALVRASADGQVLRIDHCDPSRLMVLLRDDWIDMSQEIEVRQGDTVLTRQLVPRTIATIDQTLRERGDPKGIYWGKLSVAIPANQSPSP